MPASPVSCFMPKISKRAPRISRRCWPRAETGRLQCLCKGEGTGPRAGSPCQEGRLSVPMCSMPAATIWALRRPSVMVRFSRRFDLHRLCSANIVMRITPFYGGPFANALGRSPTVKRSRARSLSGITIICPAMFPCGAGSPVPSVVSRRPCVGLPFPASLFLDSIEKCDLYASGHRRRFRGAAVAARLPSEDPRPRQGASLLPRSRAGLFARRKHPGSSGRRSRFRSSPR